MLLVFFCLTSEGSYHNSYAFILWKHNFYASWGFSLLAKDIIIFYTYRVIQSWGISLYLKYICAFFSLIHNMLKLWKIWTFLSGFSFSLPPNVFYCCLDLLHFYFGIFHRELCKSLDPVCNKLHVVKVKIWVNPTSLPLKVTTMKEKEMIIGYLQFICINLLFFVYPLDVVYPMNWLHFRW